MKRKMEQERISGWKGGTAAQWAAIQAYAQAPPPVTIRAALWQTDKAGANILLNALVFCQRR